MRVTREDFQRLAEAALARIPQGFRKLLFNLDISVRAAPGPEAGRWRGSTTLLGLYTGPSRADMTSPFAHGYAPARIVLYKRNLESQAGTREELRRLVHTTVRHEIAHHFGFTDEELREKWPEGA